MNRLTPNNIQKKPSLVAASPNVSSLFFPQLLPAISSSKINNTNNSRFTSSATIPIIKPPVDLDIKSHASMITTNDHKKVSHSFYNNNNNFNLASHQFPSSKPSSFIDGSMTWRPTVTTHLNKNACLRRSMSNDRLKGKSQDYSMEQSSITKAPTTTAIALSSLTIQQRQQNQEAHTVGILQKSPYVTTTNTSYNNNLFLSSHPVKSIKSFQNNNHYDVFNRNATTTHQREQHYLNRSNNSQSLVSSSVYNNNNTTPCKVSCDSSSTHPIQMNNNKQLLRPITETFYNKKQFLQQQEDSIKKNYDRSFSSDRIRINKHRNDSYETSNIYFDYPQQPQSLLNIPRKNQVDPNVMELVATTSQVTYTVPQNIAAIKNVSHDKNKQLSLKPTKKTQEEDFFLESRVHPEHPINNEEDQQHLKSIGNNNNYGISLPMSDVKISELNAQQIKTKPQKNFQNNYFVNNTLKTLYENIAIQQSYEPVVSFSSLFSRKTKKILLDPKNDSNSIKDSIKTSNKKQGTKRNAFLKRTVKRKLTGNDDQINVKNFPDSFLNFLDTLEPQLNKKSKTQCTNTQLDSTVIEEEVTCVKDNNSTIITLEDSVPCHHVSPRNSETTHKFHIDISTAGKEDYQGITANKLSSPQYDMVEDTLSTRSSTSVASTTTVEDFKSHEEAITSTDSKPGDVQKIVFFDPSDKPTSLITKNKRRQTHCQALSNAKPVSFSRPTSRYKIVAYEKQGQFFLRQNEHVLVLSADTFAKAVVTGIQLTSDKVALGFCNEDGKRKP